ncbi:hypothetical protein ACH5AG_08560 [Streptomyces anulatus]
MTTQPDRLPLDDLTSDALDALYADLDRYEVVVGDLNEANIGLQRQAARAEATVARVRQAVDAGPGRVLLRPPHPRRTQPAAGPVRVRATRPRPMPAVPHRQLQPPLRLRVPAGRHKGDRMIRPITVRLAPETSRLLRLYRGQQPATVLGRAMRMLAQADGHLDAAGNIKQQRP